MLPSMSAAAFALVSVLLAGAVGGLTGFGFNLVATPPLIMVMPTKAAVAVLGWVSAIQSALMLWRLRKWTELRRVWPMILAGVAGIPVGTALLLLLDVDSLKMIIGGTSALAALTMLLGFDRPVGEGKVEVGAVGFASGVIGGTTGLSGPPVVLFLANQGTEKQAFRGNLSAHFTTLGLFRLLTYSAGGLFTTETVRLAAILLPAALLGTWAGMRLAPKVDEALFRRLTLLTLVLTSLLVVASGLGWL